MNKKQVMQGIRENGDSDSNRVLIKSGHYLYDINNIYEIVFNKQTAIVIEEGSQVYETAE